MDETPQQIENNTNSLSEHHVHSAIETVLANRVQTYEEFMDAFMVLTPDDVANYTAQRNIAAGNQNMTVASRLSPNPLGPSTNINEASSKLQSTGSRHGNQKHEEELEVEELGDDLVSNEEVSASSKTPRTSKYIQVDNYLDEPDSESEFLSDDNEELDFDDDSSNRYVASFDAEPKQEDGAAKSDGPVVVTPEMVQEANDDGDIDTSQEVPTTPPFPGPYPGEIDEGGMTSPHPGAVSGSIHITQLPHSARIPTPSEVAPSAESGPDDEMMQDAVEPFSIDPDFDYDNVVLTPKWQPGDGPPSGT